MKIYFQRLIYLLILLMAFACSREQQTSPSVQGKGGQQTEEALLATIAPDEQPQSFDSSASHDMPSAESQPAVFQILFSDNGRGVAYLNRKGGGVRVTHNGKAGKPYQSIGAMAISPDGSQVAYSAFAGGNWRMVIGGREDQPYAEVGEPVFSSDGKHVAYQARIGDRWHVVVDGNRNEGTGTHYVALAFSADSTRIAYTENADEKNKARLIVSDLAFKKQDIKESAGALMAVNGNRTRVTAVSGSRKGQMVMEFGFDNPAAVNYGAGYDAVTQLAFGVNNAAVSYVAHRRGELLLVLSSREERLAEGIPTGSPVVRPDGKGAGLIMISNNGVFLHQAFRKDRAQGRRYDEAADFVYSSDSSRNVYAARRGNSWFAVVNDKEGPAFDRVVKPVFSPDSTRLVYRARKGDKRFVVVADATGTIIRQHPAYDQVFQPVFIADGTSVAYGVKDGQKLIWKVEKLDK